LLSCAASVATLLKMRKGPDPEKPKKPSTAFLLFLADFRKQNKNQKLVPKEVVKKGAEEWKSAAKSKYEKEAEKLKVDYEKEMKKYLESGRAEMWKRDPNKPKRPLNGFIQFMQDENMTPSAESKKAWAALDAKKKEAYEKSFQEELAKYNKALETYAASGSEEKWKEKVGLKYIEDAIEKKAEKAKALKEKEKAKKEKKKEKEKALKEKEKAKALKEKEKENATAKALKKKEKAKALKEKEKLKAMKEKEKAKPQKEKEMLKAKNLKLKQAAKAKKTKVTA